MRVSTTRSAGSLSTPARYNRICRFGSVAEPGDRCGVRSRSPTAAEWLRARDLPPGFEIVLPSDQPLDPVKEPETTRETLATMAAAGTTTVSARFIHHSLEHYLEQIHALAELHASTFA
jgi:hypothetical protein